MLDPITPGEILRTEFMVRWGISQNRLARELDVPLIRFHKIMHGQRGLTADTALCLSLGLVSPLRFRTLFFFMLKTIIHRVVQPAAFS